MELHKLALKLDVWARTNGLSYVLNYSEPEDNYSIEIQSAAKCEEFYVKRCYGFDDFIFRYEHRNG